MFSRTRCKIELLFLIYLKNLVWLYISWHASVAEYCYHGWKYFLIWINWIRHSNALCITEYRWNKISLRLYQSVEYYSNPENILVPQFDNSSVQNSQDPEKFNVFIFILQRSSVQPRIMNPQCCNFNSLAALWFNSYSFYISSIWKIYRFSIEMPLNWSVERIKRKTLMWRTWPKHRLCYESLKQQVFSCKSDIHLHSILNGKSIYHHDRIIGVKTK